MNNQMTACKSCGRFYSLLVYDKCPYCDGRCGKRVIMNLRKFIYSNECEMYLNLFAIIAVLLALTCLIFITAIVIAAWVNNNMCLI